LGLHKSTGSGLATTHPGSIYYGSPDSSSGRRTSAHQDHGFFAQRRESLRRYGILQGIMGFGPDGEIRTSRLLDLSLDLPLIIEFYDLPERAESVINHLQTHLGLSHVVSWSATSHTKNL
jgi:PII-like signaling protein